MTDLNAPASIARCGLKWDLRQAHDVNDDGWIICWGRRDADSTIRHALLLIPFGECPEDVDRDGDVDSADYNYVLAHLGDCPVGEICWADVDGSCAVNGTDAFIVAQAFGECGAEGFAGDPVLSWELAELWLQAGGESGIEDESIALEQLVAALSQSSSEEESLAALFELFE